MIYIIGVDHDLQSQPNHLHNAQFVEYLQKIIKEFNIKLIFEEWSTDASSLWRISHTVVQTVADKLKILYIPCDPSTKEQKELGYWDSERDLGVENPIEKAERTRSNLHKKEDYWLGKIEPCQVPVLVDS